MSDAAPDCSATWATPHGRRRESAVTGRRSRLARDVGMTGATQVIVSIAAIGSQSISAHVLGVRAYGILAGGQAAALLVEGIIYATASDIAIRVLSTLWHAPGRSAVRPAMALLASAERRRAVAIGLGAAVVMTVASFGGVAWGPVTLVFLVGTIAQSGFATSKSLLNVAGRFPLLSRLERAYAVYSLSLCAIGVYFGGVWGAAAATSLSAFVKARTYRVASKRLDGLAETVAATDDADARAVVAEAAHLSRHSPVRALLNAAGTQADVLLMSAFGGASETAFFRAGKTLAQLPARVANPVWAALRPRMIVRQQHGGTAAFLRAALLAGAAIGAVLGVTALAVWFLKTWIVQTVFGAAFAPAELPFLIQFTAGAITAAGAAWYPLWVPLSRRQLHGTIATVVGVTATLGAVAFLAPRGATAASWGILIGASVSVMAVWFVATRERAHAPAAGVNVRSDPIASDRDVTRPAPPV